MLPQADVKETYHNLCTSLGLRLRKDCRFQSFVTYYTR
jgi:hypothetical protein